MRLRTILIGAAIVGASFLGASVAMQVLSPGPGSDQRPALVEVPPLKQVSRTSMIVTPTAIALTAIRDALDASAPRNLTGKRENPISQLLSNADIGWTMGRGPLAVTGRPEAMAISSALAKEHYREHVGKSFFKPLVQYITSTPVVAMVVEGPNAVEVCRSTIGATNPVAATPGSIRGDYAIQVGRNLVHGSDSVKSAKREVKLFFKASELVAYKRATQRWITE